MSQDLERGHITPVQFIAGAYDDELASCVAAGLAPAELPRVSAAQIMKAIAGQGAVAPRPAYAEAIAALRNAGYKTIALTNNFQVDEDALDPAKSVGRMFDCIIESSVVGLRKPNPKIYQLACETAGVRPRECIFLGRHLTATHALIFAAPPCPPALRLRALCCDLVSPALQTTLVPI